MNLPNSITMGRIFCVPVLIWMLSPHFPHSGFYGEQEIIASAFFIIVSISDGIDGYLARRRGQITTMGMLLDPIADKLLITSAYVELVQFNPHVVKPWIVVVVVGREFLVSGLRQIASTEGFTIEASDAGKLKTVIQIISVVLATLDEGWHAWRLGWFIFPVHLFAVVGIYYMAAISILTGVDYFVAFWRKIEKAAATQRNTDNAFVLSRKQERAVPPAHNVTQL
ncbi:MAG TPA: CDP-diacylglycerol--glycerol-3-phosphate 3-phosphatidyltransferase [Acidobacteriaceae bacterium]